MLRTSLSADQERNHESGRPFGKESLTPTNPKSEGPASLDPLGLGPAAPDPQGKAPPRPTLGARGLSRLTPWERNRPA
jgi:hypothetical protein